MKYSTKLSDAIHILVLISINEGDNLSSNTIAESIKTNPAFIRQIMKPLKDANIINCVHGHAKPTLTKSTNEITLYEIYKAIDKDKPLLHLDTHTNPECGVGVNIQLSIKDYYNEVQRVAEEKMKSITLNDIITNIKLPL